MNIDKQRIAAVRQLEALGYRFEGLPLAFARLRASITAQQDEPGEPRLLSPLSNPCRTSPFARRQMLTPKRTSPTSDYCTAEIASSE